MSTDDDDYEQQRLVLDIGSFLTKVGYAGDDTPRVVIPSIIGKKRENDDIIDIKYPIQRGIITSCNDMEFLLYDIFYNQLKIKTDEYPTLLTDPSLNPTSNKEKLYELMFETFEVPSMLIVPPGVLSLYSAGRTTGIVFSSGHGHTDTYPVYEGYGLNHAVNRVSFGGIDITNNLINNLSQKGYSFNTSSEIAIARDIKETLGLICDDSDSYKKRLEMNYKKEYILPDGNKIIVGTDRFKCGELLFEGNSAFHKLIYESVMKCSIDVRRDLLSNIIICGGTTLMNGFESRLKKEIKKIIPNNLRARFSGWDERLFSVFIGGSILASFTNYDAMWITANEYDESGGNIMYRTFGI